MGEEGEERGREGEKSGQYGGARTRVCLCVCVPFPRSTPFNRMPEQHSYWEKAKETQNLENNQPLNSYLQDCETLKIHKAVRTTTYFCNVFQVKNVTVHKNRWFFFFPPSLWTGGLRFSL